MPFYDVRIEPRGVFTDDQLKEILEDAFKAKGGLWQKPEILNMD